MMNMDEYDIKAIKRFEGKTVKTDNGCIEWTASKGNKFGHGVFYYKNKRMYAHRFIYEFKHKMCILPSYVIMHKCDNPSCVNIEHLKLGTYKDNVQDMWNKGRNSEVYKIRNDEKWRIALDEGLKNRKPKKRKIEKKKSNSKDGIIEKNYRKYLESLEKRDQQEGPQPLKNKRNYRTTHWTKRGK